MNKDTNEAGVKLTPEEYAERRSKAIEHLTSEIEYLEMELKFETLSADIEENKLRKLVAMTRQGHILAPPPEDKDPKQEPDKTPEA